MLLVEHKRPFDDGAWILEIKFDGYRLMASTGLDGVHLKTRGGGEATRWFLETVAALRALDLPAGDHVFDGEICVLDDYGRTDFDRLHHRALARRAKPGSATFVYCIFDLLIDAGRDILHEALSYRPGRWHEGLANQALNASPEHHLLKHQLRLCRLGTERPLLGPGFEGSECR